MANRMRRILCALLACVLFAAALPSAMAQTTYSMYFCKSTKVYQKASSSSRSLSVPKNMKVTMLAARGDWEGVRAQIVSAKGYYKRHNDNGRLTALRTLHSALRKERAA